MAFQISHGLMNGLHKVLSSCADRDVEKIREAILIVLSIHVVMIELQNMHQFANISMYLVPECDLFLLERKYKLVMSLQDHVVRVM